MHCPTGTVAFLYTDIEGSTRLWERFPEEMRRALLRHDALMRQTIESAGGHVFRTMGDAFCASFFTAKDAVSAALQSQIAIADEPWPEPVQIRVRMAVHAGAVDFRDGDYHGPPMNRVARLLATGHGGQVLLSDVAQDLVRDVLPKGSSLRPLGEHRLKDLGRPESVYQLCHPSLRSDYPSLCSLANLPNNLPEHLSSFIGRQPEIAEVRSLLGQARLLTLTGAGGCGKTRLAFQVASEMLESYEDGVWVAELASLSDKTLLPQTIGEVFGLMEQANKRISEVLADYLRSKRLLLVLDNCEHLLLASSQLMDGLLRQCPRLSVLATSREPFGIVGERTYRVPPLSLPDPEKRASADDLIGFDSIRLFVERAQCYAPAFAVTVDNAPALASVCRRLDGVPLAIELAAARVRSMTVAEVDQRLDHRFRLLTGGSRTSLPRQQTLRSLIDWSYDLLTDAEKSLLSRVSVFAGGWTLHAAEEVCTGDSIEPDEVLDLLTSLVDKSLAFAEDKEGITRYGLLETVREYGKERLAEWGETAAWHERHLDYFLVLAEDAEPRMKGPDQRIWYDRLQAERDNLRAAIAWAIERSESSDKGLRLAGAMWRFWYVRGYFAEGRQWLSALLDMEPARQDPVARAKALTGAGVFAYEQADNVVALKFQEEALSIVRALEDRKGMGYALNRLANIALTRTDYAAARSLYDEAMGCSRASGDEHQVGTILQNMGLLAWLEGDLATAKAMCLEAVEIKRRIGDQLGIASCLAILGDFYRTEGDLLTAQRIFQESLELHQQLNSVQGMAHSHHGLGITAANLGDIESARSYLRQSLAVRKVLRDRMNIIDSLSGLARVDSLVSNISRAARLWGAVEKLREDTQNPRPPLYEREFEANIAAARAAMANDEEFDRAWQEGRAMTMDEAIDYGLDEEVA